MKMMERKALSKLLSALVPADEYFILFMYFITILLSLMTLADSRLFFASYFCLLNTFFVIILVAIYQFISITKKCNGFSLPNAAIGSAAHQASLSLDSAV